MRSLSACGSISVLIPYLTTSWRSLPFAGGQLLGLEAGTVTMIQDVTTFGVSHVPQDFMYFVIFQRIRRALEGRRRP
jgi:hypothetical protein